MHDGDTTTTALVEPEPLVDPEAAADESGDEVGMLTPEELHLHELDTIAREMITKLGAEAFGEDPALEAAADSLLEVGDAEASLQDETLPFEEEDEAEEAGLLTPADELAR